MFLVTSCAGTKFLSEWKDSAYSDGALQKIMIVGVSDKMSNKRIFEDELAGQLKNHGTEAVSSAAIIPTMKELDETVIKKAALR